MNEVRFTRQAEKDVKGIKVPADRERLRQEFEDLARDLRSGERLKSGLNLAWPLKFALSGGEYRIAYVPLFDEGVAIIFLVAPRENFYREATRRYEGLRRSGRL